MEAANAALGVAQSPDDVAGRRRPSLNNTVRKKMKLSAFILLSFALAKTEAASQPPTGPGDGRFDTPPPVTKKVLPAPDVQATPIKRLDPLYPPDLRSQSVEGKVTLGVIVDRNGDVSHAQVLQEDRWQFSVAAIACVWQWKFKPAEKGGKPIPSFVQVPFVFSLPKKNS